jgi:hypothetical protein
MQPYSYSLGRLSAAGHLPTAAALWLILALHLLPAMFAGLPVFALVNAPASGMQRHLPGARAHGIVVALLAAVVVGILTRRANLSARPESASGVTVVDWHRIYCKNIALSAPCIDEICHHHYESRAESRKSTNKLRFREPITPPLGVSLYEDSSPS